MPESPSYRTPEHFGGDPTGAADSTTAVQECFDFFNDSGNAQRYVGAFNGTYRITDTVEINGWRNVKFLNLGSRHNSLNFTANPPRGLLYSGSAGSGPEPQNCKPALLMTFMTMCEIDGISIFQLPGEEQPFTTGILATNHDGGQLGNSLIRSLTISRMERGAVFGLYDNAEGDYGPPAVHGNDDVFEQLHFYSARINSCRHPLRISARTSDSSSFQHLHIGTYLPYTGSGHPDFGYVTEGLLSVGTSGHFSIDNGVIAQSDVDGVAEVYGIDLDIGAGNPSISNVTFELNGIGVLRDARVGQSRLGWTLRDCHTAQGSQTASGVSIKTRRWGRIRDTAVSGNIEYEQGLFCSGVTFNNLGKGFVNVTPGGVETPIVTSVGEIESEVLNLASLTRSPHSKLYDPLLYGKGYSKQSHSAILPAAGTATVATITIPAGDYGCALRIKGVASSSEATAIVDSAILINKPAAGSVTTQVVNNGTSTGGAPIFGTSVAGSVVTIFGGMAGAIDSVAIVDVEMHAILDGAARHLQHPSVDSSGTYDLAWT